MENEVSTVADRYVYRPSLSIASDTRDMSEVCAGSKFGIWKEIQRSKLNGNTILETNRRA
jgi:hypothetical protein